MCLLAGQPHARPAAPTKPCVSGADVVAGRDGLAGWWGWAGVGGWRARGGKCPAQFEEGHLLEKVRGDQGIVLLHLGSILALRLLRAGCGNIGFSWAQTLRRLASRAP